MHSHLLKPHQLMSEAFRKNPTQETIKYINRRNIYKYVFKNYNTQLNSLKRMKENDKKLFQHFLENRRN
jgi:hypothetical protein